MRSAISSDRSALPLSKLDRAGRKTWSALAVAATDRHAGSIISVRIKSPGWGRIFMGTAYAPVLMGAGHKGTNVTHTTARARCLSQSAFRNFPASHWISLGKTAIHRPELRSGD